MLEFKSGVFRTIPASVPVLSTVSLKIDLDAFSAKFLAIKSSVGLADSQLNSSFGGISSPEQVQPLLTALLSIPAGGQKE